MDELTLTENEKIWFMNFMKWLQVVVSRNIQNPVGLAVFEDMIYWADQDHGSVYSADLDTSRRLLPIVTNVGHVTDIVIDHPVLHNVTYGSQGICFYYTTSWRSIGITLSVSSSECCCNLCQFSVSMDVTIFHYIWLLREISSQNY